jgi:diaminopimelate epimerase
MVYEFTKMNGAGNDFILMDNRRQAIRLNRDQVVRFCHRQRGIGADGLVLLIPGTSGNAPWAWEFYNSDGSVAEMCGNAARCFARYVQRLTGAGGEIRFETGAGMITAHPLGERVAVNMPSPKDLRLDQEIPLKGGPQRVHSLNTGVPHTVVYVADADQAMVQGLGAEIRYHPHFAPKGTNVNFVQLLEDKAIRVRTYERGVEGETLACGTGVTASALITARIHQLKGPVRVRVQGGDWLEVDFEDHDGQFSDVQLSGPAEFVYEGRIAD